MVGKDCEGAFSKPAFCSAPLSMDRFEWIVNVMGRGILCRYSQRWHLRVPAGANAARNVGKFGNSASHSLTGQPLETRRVKHQQIRESNLGEDQHNAFPVK